VKQEKINGPAMAIPVGGWCPAARLVAGLVLVALLGGVAQAQPRRGTPIDSPPQTNIVPATNGPAALTIATNALATNAVSPAPKVNAKIEGDYLEVGFDKLSAFPVRVIYETVNPATLAYAPKILGDIPPTILALNEKKVAVKGFMLPLKQQDGFITEFLLLKNQSMCCYGMSPKVNEWVQVQMKGKGVRSIMDEPIIICGTLHVGEYQENQQLAGIYRLAGDKLIKPVATP
jgi:hypothetical protein